MAKDLNSYEEARKQRIEDNKRRFQELGVIKMANSLTDINKKKNKRNQAKVKSNATSTSPDVVRRSSRPRNKVSYSEGIGTTNCKTSFLNRDALKRAESFQSGLLSGKPSFVKSMSATNVSRNFTLSIPVEIRNNHLSKEKKVRIVLENEEGLVYETNYNGTSGYLSTGWKTFCMDHKLDNGDALVIELIEPTRFKVHIFKVSNDIVEVQVDELMQARKSNYIATRVVTKAERSKALNRAMSFQSRLPSSSPSFVKSMSHRHFIPVEVRNNHVSKEKKVRLVLENEEGLVYETNYNGAYGYLSTGWRTFCMDHKLDNGDALVFELIEPTRFKVHIFRVPNDIGEGQVLI
ncbi:hypothetical protein MKW94_008380 [Papaver nudicaule]|uniref:TF-B3 domain-containing protein n=1 Tax=Papaver nudicaule TaxID=74823 RepID=A0AA41SDZ4_PAPNU|nr:hypothetical protein [Papaver nudicaule]